MVVLYFLFGTVIGSFLNVLIDRLSQNRQFINERSICDSCKKQLQWYELIPLLSFAIQQGRCRHCKTKIPSRLFIIEFVTGLLFASTYTYFSSQLTFPQLVLLLISICALVVIFQADVEYRIIPDQMLIVLAASSIVSLSLYYRETILLHLLMAVLCFLLFLGLYLVTKGRGIGFGDVKFSFVIGLMLGFPQSILALYSAFILGAVVALLLVALKIKKMRGDTIAFGPFMVLGVVVAYLFSDMIMRLFL